MEVAKGAAGLFSHLNDCLKPDWVRSLSPVLGTSASPAAASKVYVSTFQQKASGRETPLS